MGDRQGHATLSKTQACTAAAIRNPVKAARPKTSTEVLGMSNASNFLTAKVAMAKGLQ